MAVLTSLNRQPLSKSTVRSPWLATPRFGSPAPLLSEAGPTSLGVVWAAAVAVSVSMAAATAHAARLILLRPIDLTSLGFLTPRPRRGYPLPGRPNLKL